MTAQSGTKWNYYGKIYDENGNINNYGKLIDQFGHYYRFNYNTGEYEEIARDQIPTDSTIWVEDENNPGYGTTWTIGEDRRDHFFAGEYTDQTWDADGTPIYSGLKRDDKYYMSQIIRGLENTYETGSDMFHVEKSSTTDNVPEAQPIVATPEKNNNDYIKPYLISGVENMTAGHVDNVIRLINDQLVKQGGRAIRFIGDAGGKFLEATVIYQDTQKYSGSDMWKAIGIDGLVYYGTGKFTGKFLGGLTYNPIGYILVSGCIGIGSDKFSELLKDSLTTDSE
ncbi:hypothetical protein, partial [Pectinatus frisingensis]|uniref:hypothetical protein n=1 Tax=Pectinatus frisingensis TaxID=865 RepID=UPI0018C852D8